MFTITNSYFSAKNGHNWRPSDWELMKFTLTAILLPEQSISVLKCPLSAKHKKKTVFNWETLSNLSIATRAFSRKLCEPLFVSSRAFNKRKHHKCKFELIKCNFNRIFGDTGCLVISREAFVFKSSKGPNAESCSTLVARATLHVRKVASNLRRNFLKLLCREKKEQNSRLIELKSLYHLVMRWIGMGFAIVTYILLQPCILYPCNDLETDDQRNHGRPR